MANGIAETRFNRGAKEEKPSKSQAELDCAAAGGSWNPTTQTCTLPTKKVQEAPLPSPKPEIKLTPDKRNIGGIELPPREGEKDPRIFEGLSPDEVREIADRETGRLELPEDTVPFGTREAQLKNQAEINKLSGTVGQTEVTPTLEPTDISQSESLAVAVREGVPRALTLAGGAAVAGATAGLATGGAASVPLAAAASAVAFVGSMTASILGNMKSQRTDTTNAQQRVLDEGKQTLQDWSTQAAADPANRAFYLSQFNNQMQIIQDAHVQMLTDTNADVAKFETALPNLAEFNSFYNVGGERDALVSDMQRSLRGEVGQLEVNFRMLDLGGRNNPIQTERTKGFFEGLLP